MTTGQQTDYRRAQQAIASLHDDLSGTQTTYEDLIDELDDEIAEQAKELYKLNVEISRLIDILDANHLAH